MLALRTGWTERTIGERISDDFRRACHHALYAEAMSEFITDARVARVRVADIDITTVPTSERGRVRATQAAAAGVIADVRALIGLDEEPGAPGEEA